MEKTPIIDRILLDIRTEGGTASHMFAAAAMKDTRVIPLAGKGTKDFPKDGSFILQCSVEDLGEHPSDICLSYDSRHDGPDVDTVVDLAKHLESFGFKVAINNPQFDCMRLGRSADSLVMAITVNSRSLAAESVEEGMARLEQFRDAFGDMYRRILDNLENTRRHYWRSICLLYRNRQAIYSNPQYFFSSTGVRIYGFSGGIPLGIMLKGIDEDPGAFRLKGDDLEEERPFVFSFSGSPMSGTCVVSIADPKTGHIRSHTTGGFMSRCQSLKRIMERYRKDMQEGLPVDVVASILEHKEKQI